MPVPHWREMFAPSQAPLEMVIRGTITYLALLIMLRMVNKRQSGNFGLSDMLLIVILADAAQNAMAGEYKSITDGLILVATLVFWNYFLDYLGYRSRFFEQLTHPPPLKLVENGKMLRKNMRREFITEAELMSHLREEGCESVEEVKAAFIEGDGEISVIKRE